MLEGTAARAARATLMSNLARARTGPASVRRVGSVDEVALVSGAGNLMGTGGAGHHDGGGDYSEPDISDYGARGRGGLYGGGRSSYEGHGGAGIHWGGSGDPYGFAFGLPEGEGGELGCFYPGILGGPSPGWGPSFLPSGPAFHPFGAGGGGGYGRPRWGDGGHGGVGWGHGGF